MGLLVEYQVRPTVLIPVWKLAGFTLGAGCSLLGEKGAMACTVAVEALVTKHYDDQVTEMVSNNPKLDEKLMEVIKKFRDDEQSHHDIGLAHGAEEAPGYNFLTAVIGFGYQREYKVANMFKSLHFHHQVILFNIRIF